MRIILFYVHSFLSQIDEDLFAVQSVLLYFGNVCIWVEKLLVKLTYVIIGIRKFLCALNNLGALVLNYGLKSFLNSVWFGSVQW